MVCVLGGSGRLGKEILSELERNSIPAKALVRNPSKLNSSYSHIQIVEGNPGNLEDLGKTMIGCTGIISSLNVSRKSDFPWSKLRSSPTLISDTIRAVLEKMESYSIDRIISVSAWGTHQDIKAVPGWFRWIIKNSNVGKAYEDHERQEDLLSTTNLNWTIVRPVGLTNSQKIKKLIVSFNNHPKPKLTISRKHVAQFIVSQLNSSDYIRKMPVISET